MTTHTLTIEEALGAAVALQRSNHLPEAEALLNAILEAEPKSPDALHFMGILRRQQDRWEDAEKLIRQAIEICPTYADAWNNLGNIYKATKRPYEALDAFERAVELGPNLAEAHLNYASMLKRASRLAEATASYRRAVALNPQLGEAHLALGNALYMMGHIDEAAAAFKDWCEIDPENAVARHMAAACGQAQGQERPDRASDDFVRHSFDNLAASFDEKMESLHYGAPALVSAALAKVRQPDGSLDVLDAGCGTGLCGALLAPYARRLTGVDLSRAMVDKCRARGQYHELVEGELTAFLEQSDGAYDAIVSADTLVYFGDLSRVLRAAARALRAGGILVFTVESLDGAPESVQAQGFFLHPHGRYGHAEPYVRQVLQDAGLEVLDVGRDTLRMEIGQPVRGLIVTARKS
jgi:predicted TPR repeat methyltransferase